MSHLRLVFLLVLFSLTSASAFAITEIDQPHVRASLIAEHDAVTPGVSETLALKLVPDPKWHVYWRYAGDSGAAPILQWEVNGQSVDVPVKWPVPERLEVGPFVNYGYEGEVIFMSSLPIPKDASGEVNVKLDAEWLVCEEECIPGNALFELSIPVVTEKLPGETKQKALFQQFRERLPVKAEGMEISIREIEKNSFALSFPASVGKLQSFSFLPYREGIVENAARQLMTVKTDNESTGVVTLSLRRPKNLTPPKELQGLIVRDPPFRGGVLAKEISVPFPVLGTQAEGETGKESAEDEASTNFLLVLLAAFAGGLILNLMPCVFPVLSIKILGFVKKAGKEDHQVRNHGLAFGAGILVSFWLMALLVRGLREAGEKLGWGFQLQNPTFVAFLVLLLIAVALNLFGVFEVGSRVQRACGSIDKDKEGYTNSFLSGVLATLLATPCTAPFMGGAIAYGISTSLLPSLLVFSMLALGLAAPYLILSFFPKLLASLPKPGAWMETFKELMGFPVLLTALWLLWVFEKQSSSGELLALLLAIVLFSFGLWMYGKISPPTASRKQQLSGLAVFLIALVLSCWVGIPFQSKAKRTVAEPKQVSTDAPFEKDAYGQTWYTYSPELVEKLLGEKKPLYIDFTAAWCITCQVNKRMVFGSEEVRTAFGDKNIVLIKGDWTNEDPVITEALEQFDRLGVPLNILYDPAAPEKPVVFPSVLTPQMVLKEVAKLS